MSKFEYIDVYIDRITQKRGLGIRTDETDYLLICFIEEKNNDSDYQLYQEDEFIKLGYKLSKEDLTVQKIILKLIDRSLIDTKITTFLKNNYLVSNK